MMMKHMVHTKTYCAPEINKNEILRYAGVLENCEAFTGVLDECLHEILPKLVYKVCFCEVPITVGEDFVDLGFIRLCSYDLKNAVKHCSSIILFAATIGIETDRFIARYSSVSPVKALFFQAIGAERIESLCNEFNRQMTEEKKVLNQGTTPRFSPGYGDLPLAVQRDIFKVLDPPRKIGLMLNDSLLMSPSKSVTAMIGVTENCRFQTRQTGCKNCDKTDCEFRRNR